MSKVIHHDPVPWLREELQNKTAALEQEIASHRHTLSLLRATENAYGRFVPHQLLNLLHAKSILDLSLGEQIERRMTILFSDIRDFTRLSEAMSPRETFSFINSYLSEMEPVISQHGGVVDKYIGDAIMALFPTSADAGLQSAIDMLGQLQRYNEGRERAGYAPIRIGIGLNTGIVMLGTVGGSRRMEGTVLSDAVNLASRLEETTKVYQAPLLISEHTLYALKDESSYHIRFLDRILVKGRTQPQSVYEVFDNDEPDVRAGKEQMRQPFEEAVAYYHLKQVERAIPLLEACLEVVPSDYPAQIYLQRCQDFLATGQHTGCGEIGETLVWRDEFETGVAEIDQEHRALVDCMNNLALLVRRGDVSGLSSAVSFLSSYVHAHFGNEERLMHDWHYPMLGEHVQEHRRFVQEFGKLKEAILGGQHDALYLCFQIQLLMFDWFAHHTTRTDRHLSRFILARQAEEAAQG